MKNFEGKKLDVGQAREFLFGGNSVFTIKSEASGKHLTFKVTKKEDEKWGDKYFVKVYYMEGWNYVGFVREEKKWRLEKGRKGMDSGCKSWKVADWVFRHLGHPKEEERNLNGAEFWHEGRCGCCGRQLTDPESIDRGIGPVCWGRIQESKDLELSF